MDFNLICTSIANVHATILTSTDKPHKTRVERSVRAALGVSHPDLTSKHWNWGETLPWPRYENNLNRFIPNYIPGVRFERFLTQPYHGTSDAFGCVAWKKYFILSAMHSRERVYTLRYIFSVPPFSRFSRSFTQSRSSSGCCWFIRFVFTVFDHAWKFNQKIRLQKIFFGSSFSVNVYFVNTVYLFRLARWLHLLFINSRNSPMCTLSWIVKIYCSE